MLRFIEIGEQICEGNKDFAWYDTVTDEFLTFSGVQTWETWKEFVIDTGNGLSSIEIKRFNHLYPHEREYCKSCGKRLNAKK